MNNTFELSVGWFDDMEDDDICVYYRNSYPTEAQAIEAGKSIMESNEDGCDYFIIKNENEL
jgi:hypothetical protein